MGSAGKAVASWARVIAVVAVASALAFVAVAHVWQREPWDLALYGPLLAGATAAASFAGPRQAIPRAVAIALGQLLGWALDSLLFAPQAWSWWPMLLLLTFPLFIVPAVIAGALAGGIAGWWWRRG